MVGKGRGERQRGFKIGLAVLALAASAVGAAIDVSTAAAAFPGRDGRIICQSNRDGNPEIYAFNPDGTDPRRITNHPAADIEGTPSPDGTRIAFTSTRESNHPGNPNVDAQEIWVMYQDGSGAKKLTNTPGEDRPGTWSPDGTQISFHSGRFPVPPGPGHSTFEVMKMNADGSNQTRLTNNNFQDSFAHWSPRGDKIAFTTNRDSFVDHHGQLVSNFEIYTMNTDGSNQTRITNSPGEDAHAHWSPNASHFTFHSRRDFLPTPTALQIEIYRMHADGSNPVRLTGPDNVFDVFPAWSPSNQKVVWSSQFPSDVFTMNASDGSAKTNITNTPPTFDDTRCDWGRLLPCTVSGSGDIHGTAHSDVICGSAGNDRISGLGGNDVFYPGAGNDQVTGGAGNDIVFGDHGNDTIAGEGGNDTLFGDQEDDSVAGGPGDDIVSGSEGTDTVSGNGGTDECYGETVTGCP